MCEAWVVVEVNPLSVWYAIPSARPDGGTIWKWKGRGYKVAACVDEGQSGGGNLDILQSIMPYPGYAYAVNNLVELILDRDPEVAWIVTGGDDTDPALSDPREIAAQCTEHFGGTFGVMQPTGDRWAGGSIDRICGSPWMGREFCERMYGGDGPLWSGWQHCFVDEELQCVAQRLGVLGQRRDLTHKHNHWLRCEGPDDVNWKAVEPEHLKDKNPTLQRDRPLFNQRKARGFPGHEPLGKFTVAVDVTQHHGTGDACRYECQP